MGPPWSRGGEPRVEILYFDGCPNHEPAQALVERLATQLGIEPDIRLIEVPDADAAVALRFLGSPTVRVNGQDVEPGADERPDFALSCRIYRSESGISEQPDARWLREALTEARDVNTDREGASEEVALARGVAATLATAEISPSKLGPARRARLPDGERELYFWILRGFATAGRPSRQDVHSAAEQLGIDAEQGLETLAREDLVHRGADGEITIAYPFSGRRTAHRVRFPGGHEVDAMCAIDALGVAPMFETPIEVESRDPASSEAIRAQVAPDGAVKWSPESAVVVAGAIRDQGDACHGCCPVLNFFASTANAKRWLGEHPEVRGTVISMREAAAAGRAVFGKVLAPT